VGQKFSGISGGSLTESIVWPTSVHAGGPNAFPARGSPETIGRDEAACEQLDAPLAKRGGLIFV
jgi:hypothetical protein